MEDEGGYLISDSDLWIFYKVFGLSYPKEAEERVSKT